MKDEGRILFASLGNPGKRYEKTRHNIGFVFADFIVSRFELPTFSYCKKMRAFISAGRICEKEVVLIKPDTYMNLSGKAVVPAMGAFDITVENIFVVHDEIDIEFGNQKIKMGGGDAGHRGVRSIVGEIGTPDFKRIRLGVGRSEKVADTSNYVLDKFLDEEWSFVENAWCSEWSDLITTLLCEGVEKAMSIYNKRRSQV
jgi:peptidyl-tRNA hydrolase, PTH1 family